MTAWLHKAANITVMMRDNAMCECHRHPMADNGVISSQWPGMRPHETLHVTSDQGGMWPVMMITRGPLLDPGHASRGCVTSDITWCSWPAAPGCQWGGARQFPNLLISQSYQSLNQLMRATPERGRVEGTSGLIVILHVGCICSKVWEINHMSSYTTQLVFLLSIPSTWY